MRRVPGVLIATLLLATLPAVAADTRTLSGSQSAGGIDVLSVDAGVGQVEVIAEQTDEIRWEVVLKPRRGGIFSSRKAGEEDVRSARLEAEVRRGELRLEVDTESRDRRFEERWTIHMPATIAFELDIGVGDVRVDGLSGGVVMDAGVGDVELDVAGGRVRVEAGVGDVTVRAPAAAYGSAEASAGVGDASIRVRNRTTESGGFLGSEASWRGDGEHAVTVEVGVGDASILLD